MNATETLAKPRQSLARRVKRLRVTINTYYPRLTRGFEDCFAVAAQAHSAINEESSPFRREELNRFS
jgi:hypothetical protein